MVIWRFGTRSEMSFRLFSRAPRMSMNSLIRWCVSSHTLPAHQLHHLNQIAAGVVQHGDLGAGHIGWRHREFSAARFHPLAVALHIVGVEHRRGLALLKGRL